MLDQVYGELRSRGQRLPRLPPARARPPRARDGSDADDAPEDARDDAALDDAEAIRACALLDELLQRFGDAYEQLKRGRGAVDFDDLELLAGQLLAERELLRAAWSDRFELLMVDEFQDTNRAPARASWRRWIAATCSRSATSSSRSTASGTPT